MYFVYLQEKRSAGSRTHFYLGKVDEVVFPLRVPLLDNTKGVIIPC